MKLLRRKKEEPARRRPIDASTPSSSAPIVRYYRPQQRSSSPVQKNGERREFGSTDKHDSNNSSVRDASSVIKKVIKLSSQWLVLCAIAGLLIVNITLAGSSVRTKGSTYAYRTSDQYQTMINDIIARNVKFRTKATLSSNSLEAEIKRQLPEVETATAIIPLAGRKLQIVLDVASPLVRLQTGSNKLAVVSAAGMVTKEDTSEAINASFSDLPSLSILGITPQVGRQILTQNESGLIRLLSREFDGSDSSRPRVESMEFDVSKREIKVRFKDKSYYAKVTPEEEGRVQVGALHKTLKSLVEQGSLPAEYVDVRVEDRVFVR